MIESLMRLSWLNVVWCLVFNVYLFFLPLDVESGQELVLL